MTRRRKTNSSPSVVLIPPNPVVAGIIVLKNNSGISQPIELFNKIHAHFIGKKDSPSQAVFVTGKVTIKNIAGKFTQDYSDFFESVLHTNIVISNVNTTNNKQINFFQKDLVMGRRPISESMMQSNVPIGGRTILQIDLLPKQKFEINFVINLVEAEMKHMRSI